MLDSPPALRDKILAWECSNDGELRAEVLAVCASYSEADELLGAGGFAVNVRGWGIGQRIGPWGVLGLLGEGGMGRVYLVERREGVTHSGPAALKLNHE